MERREKLYHKGSEQCQEIIMKGKKLPARFKRSLWSYKINKIDIEKNKEEIITQVLNHGSWDELKLLNTIYSENEIKQVVAQPRRGVWFEKVLNFWTIMLNIKLANDVYNRAIFSMEPHD